MTDKSPPDDMLAYILRELVEVKVEMVSLRAVVDAQGQMINALFVALPVSQRPAALALLHAQQMSLESEGEESAAAMLGAFVKGLQGLLGEGLERSMGEVAAAYGLTNALVRSVPAEQAKAMRTWLSIATEGEIAQDAAQLPPEQLSELLRLQASSKPARRGGAKKKKSDGG
ncbi:hypothetical protein [Alicycliphilus denitrificans]|uniref:hypothetical protein n=1 Tax=Alicycliphilus denitrificans TaxID=179636 RepID=UPI0001D9EDF3|nr:hypothetical protein [Alicycliphilus denitrificans]ADU99810.1 hypothetical protein Alide_2067 [Alicycliphilus denitrificans BC]HRP19384.1 hypothetical protein [Alicycliphilus sp.]